MTEPTAVELFPEVVEAHQRIKSYVHKTPVLTCSAVDSVAHGRKLFFKCELFQKVSSSSSNPFESTPLIASTRLELSSSEGLVMLFSSFPKNQQQEEW